MKPKMVILNKRQYYETFDQALAYSLEGEHQKSLNLLLELKEKRWIKFELFHKIAEEYEFLDKFDEANNILKQTKPESEEDFKLLTESKQRIQVKLIEKQKTENYQLFNETIELREHAHLVKEYDQLFQKIKFIRSQSELKQLNMDKLKLFQLISSFYVFGYFQSTYKIVEYILNDQFQQLNVYDQLQLELFARLLSANKYELVLDLLNMRKDDYLKFFFQGFCYYQVKQYKTAANYYTKSYQLRQNTLIWFKLSSLQSQIGLQYQNIPLIDLPLDELSVYLPFYKISKSNFKDKYIQFMFKVMLKKSITENQNCTMFLYHELFQLEYLSDKQHPILQQICDHLIKYAPRYAAGYANQYVLFIDQQRFQEAYQLAGPLFECEDSTLKFITLAKIYLAQQQNTVSSNDFNTQAHLVLEQAKEINQYEEDIYILKREVYYAEKNYQEVRQTERFLVKLEKENYLFICQLIAPIINKFEYYRAFDLLQFGDEENVKLNELKLLMQIISKPANQDREQIIKSLDEIESTSKFTFFGHYWLSQGDINLAQEYYQLQIAEQVEMGQTNMIPFYAQAREYLSNNQQNLNQYKILNIIWQISVYTYEPIEQEKYFHKRFVDTLGFVLVSFIFSQSLQQICQFINSKYDVEVPHLKDFKSVLFKSVYAIYCLDHISIDQYSGYIETGIKQLQKLLISPEQSMELFYQFCSVKKNEIVNLMNFQNNQPAKVNLILKEIYSIPFFYDPVSKIALLTAIKMIGYFVDNDLANNYQNMEEWLGAYMLKQNVEAYYRTIIKQRHLD